MVMPLPFGDADAASQARGGGHRGPAAAHQLFTALAH